jgi:hypothetical protein
MSPPETCIFVAPKFVAPKFVAPKFLAPKFLAPKFVASKRTAFRRADVATRLARMAGRGQATPDIPERGAGDVLAAVHDLE